MDVIRVGVVGASPDRGWAMRAHIPALRALPGYALTAVGTSRSVSARRAAELFGARHAFTDAGELAAHPEVDLVVVAVRVPAHAELVTAALAAGKHVHCEWPLALDTVTAEKLATAAAEARVRATVGLQTRFSPAVAHARELLAEGRIGQLTSVMLFSTRGKGAGGRVPGWSAYTLDARNGAGLLEVIGGHALDALEFVLGPVTELSALLSVRHPEVIDADTGETIEVTSPDHVLLSATLDRGAVLSVHLTEAAAGEPRTRLVLAGTDGDLVLESTGTEQPGDVQLPIGALRLVEVRSGRRRVLTVPGRHAPPSVPGVPAAANVAALYQALAEDLGTGGSRVPTFDDGVRAHRLLDVVRRAHATGTRQAGARTAATTGAER